MTVFDLVLAVLAILGGVATVVQIRLWIIDWHAARIDNFSAIEKHGLRLLECVNRSEFVPDLILGIGRSGAFLGGWLAGNLGSIPIEVIDRVHKANSADPMDFPNFAEKIALLRAIHGDKARVLVVEGATTRGATLQNFERLRLAHVPDWMCRYAVLYQVDTAAFPAQFVGKSLGRAPLRYPWHKTPEYRHHIRPPA